MLKTNSKKARENIRNYIVNHFTPENYTDTPPQEFAEIARFILKMFRQEKYSLLEDLRYYDSENAAFAAWCEGLPSLLDTCYYYNRSAVDDVAAILEETETEKAYFTEEKAEILLTALIYRELRKAEKEC